MHTINSRSGIQRAIQLLGIVGKLAIGVLLLGVVVKSNVPAANAGPALAPQAASLVISPSVIVVPPNGTGVASAVIQNDATPNGLAAAEYEMTYTPSVVNALNAYDGGFLFSTNPSRTNPSSVGITIPLKSLDNTAGLAAVGLFSLSTNPAQGTPNGPNGTGTLAKVSLKGVGAAGATSALGLQNVMTTDALANPTNVTSVTGGQLLISNQPFQLATTLTRNFNPTANPNYAFSTAVKVQNLSATDPATITLTYFDTAGQPLLSLTSNVGPNQAANFDQRFASGGLTDLANFSGAAVVAATQPIAVIVNEQPPSGPGTLGKDYRGESYSGFSSTSTGTSLTFPGVLKNITDGPTLNSLISIQNASANTATGNVTFTNAGIGNSTVKPVTIPPWSAFYINLQNEAGVGSSFLGSASVSVNQAAGATITQMGTGAAGSFQAYNGFSGGATTLYVPQVLKQLFDGGQQLTFSSGIQVRVFSGSNADINVTYFNAANVQVLRRTFTGSSTYVVDQRTEAGLPNNFLGSAIITSTSAIVANVNAGSALDATRGVTAVTYRAFQASEGSTRLLAPHILKKIADSGLLFSTGLQVQTVGWLAGDNNQVTAKFFPVGGGAPITVGPVGCNPGCNFDQRTLGGAGVATFFGTAEITSNLKPIIARVSIIGEVTTGQTVGDVAANYPATNQ